MFQKYLREYASGVLETALPRGGAGAGAGGGGGLMGALGGTTMPTLVTNLHTLLRDDAANGAGGNDARSERHVHFLFSKSR